eukprot:g7364.t1
MDACKGEKAATSDGTLLHTMGLLQTCAIRAALLALVACLASAALFQERLAGVPTVYNHESRRVWIHGKDFDTLDVSTLKLNFAPRLTKEEDYTLKIWSSRLMMLTLQPGKKWMDLADGSPPTPLYLSRASSGDETLLEEAVHIVTIRPMPSVDMSSKLIYMKTTPRLVLNGTNFNTHETKLYFDPPLQGVPGFQDKVVSSTQIGLVKAFSFRAPKLWASEPGPLKLVAIDTGAGRVLLNKPHGGVMVAVVQADLDMHGVRVQTRKSLRVYQSTKSIEVEGSGFADGMKVRFENHPRGASHFTITRTQPYRMTLELAEGRTWHTNPEALPGPLIMLAADAGDGYVPLGPTAAKTGRTVATVFEDPSVVASDAEIFRTRTRELEILGTGFNKLARPTIHFEPALESMRVAVEVVNRTMIRLSLKTSSPQWTTADNLGPLTIKGMDTGAGMKVFDPPVPVATVVPDPDVFLVDGQANYQVA